MTKIIGLTGGIGSGKTLVANYYKSLGIPVYIADDEAKQLLESSEVIAELSKEFGNTILENGKISREKISQIVFSNPEKLSVLNSIIHPKVKKHFSEWILKHPNSPFVVKEAAILFESGSYKDCDVVITIVAPLEDRIQRVMKRDGSDRESVMKRISNQWTDEQRMEKSDFVIKNITVNETLREAKLVLKKIQNT